MQAALAVTARPEMWGEPAAGMRHWTALVDEVDAAADRRVVVSSEFFADGDDEAAHRVVDDMGGSRTHVVVTLRPLTRILSSQWQQYIQNGLRTPYDKWLKDMFDRPPYSHPTPTFWGRHRHDRLVERWAAAAGPERVTVVVADESDPLMLLRTFESLVGLPSGFLMPEQEVTNRSLTLGEVELVRLLNEEFTRGDWPMADYARFIRYGAVMQMKTAHVPATGEPRISTPQWALDRAAALGAEMATKIATLGVRIVGDISTLSQVPASVSVADEHAPRGSTVASAAAAQAVLGAMAAGAKNEPRVVYRSSVKDTDAMSLVRVLLGRVRRRARGHFPRRGRA